MTRLWGLPMTRAATVRVGVEAVNGQRVKPVDAVNNRQPGGSASVIRASPCAHWMRKNPPMSDETPEEMEKAFERDHTDARRRKNRPAVPPAKRDTVAERTEATRQMGNRAADDIELLRQRSGERKTSKKNRKKGEAK